MVGAPLSSELRQVKKLTFADLPADVQHQIELHCAENNNGDRAASHSRAAMTERALAYQVKMGRRRGECEPVTDLSKPGDSEYGPLGSNDCSSCGKSTGHELVVKCLACCSKTEAVPA